MAEQKKIYLVWCGEGEYEDHHSWIVAATDNLEAAIEIGRAEDRSHFLKPVVPEEIWNEAQQRYWENHENDPEDVCPFDIKKQQKECSEWWSKREVELEAQEKREMIEILNELGFKCDEETYDRQEAYEDGLHYSYDHAHVEERVIISSPDELTGERWRGETVWDGWREERDRETGEENDED